MKLYVYCVTRGLDALPYLLHGIDGAEVGLYRSGDLCLLVSECVRETVLINRHNALAHSAVVQSILNETTPLPFRYGTLVGEDQLESYLSTHRAALQAKLKLVSDCIEMSVKIISDCERAEEPVTAPATPGTAFLSGKRREILGGEARAAEASRVAEWLEGQVCAVVREIQVSKNPTDKLILAIAHLVERDRLKHYRKLISEVRRQRPELRFLVSGPWAPYSFANIDLEFKTQFGVS